MKRFCKKTNSTSIFVLYWQVRNLIDTYNIMTNNFDFGGINTSIVLKRV
ncbi:MAG: hypothetical protein ACWIPH_04870 [Ostreibacterium sp.]